MYNTVYEAPASFITSTTSKNYITIDTQTFFVESDKIKFGLKKVNTGYQYNKIYQFSK